MICESVIVFDIDGTVAITGERLEYILCAKKDYKAFYATVKDDTVFLPIRSILHALRRAGKKIVFVTGRPERTRDDTLEWLHDNNMHCESEDLYMRADGDTRPAVEVKPELVAGFIHRIEMAFEDRTDMARLWRSMGIPCLQVDNGDF